MTSYFTDQQYRETAFHLIRLAHDAGRAIMPYYGSDLDITLKNDESPVTAADTAAESVILTGLKEHCPQIPVIAEESVTAGHIPEISDTFFLVDPLDGTREFIGKRQEFTVNIALIVEQRPYMGVVYAPALGALFVTLAADKAFEATLHADTELEDVSSIDFREIKVRDADMNGLTVVASRSHLDEKTEEFLTQYAIAEKRPAGSSIKFCAVAQGEADLYPRFGRTMEWDTAAGDAVLSAAGGTIQTVDGGSFLYGKSDVGFANPGFICWGKRPGT